MRNTTDALVLATGLLSLGLIVCMFLNWWVPLGFLAALFVGAYLGVGLARRGRLGSMLPLAGGTGIVYALFFAWLFIAYRAQAGRPPERWVGGFPPDTAVIIYAIWPLFILVGLAYVWAFDRWIHAVPRQPAARHEGGVSLER